MRARLSFLAIAAFWVTMNVLLWRAEYGVHGGDTPVPLLLVWHKVLTAPDASSLSVYQNGDRMGYCEVSSGVGQQMATFDEGKLTSEGFAPHNGYLLKVAGNVSLGDFTNRIKFDVRMRFNRQREWEELFVRLTTRATLLEITSLTTNQTAHIRLSNEGTRLLERDVPFADLQSPGAVLRLLAGSTQSDFFASFDPVDMLPGAADQKITWEARRTRVKIGTEAVPIYLVETSLLGHSMALEISTLGEILSVKLPDGITAHIDEWNKP